MTDSIQTDAFTSPSRPPLVLDHQGDGWSAIPHGSLTPHQRRSDDGTEGHIVRIERHGPISTLINRFTPDGAIELSTQLRRAAMTATAHDGPEHDQAAARIVAEDIEEDYRTLGQQPGFVTGTPGEGKTFYIDEEAIREVVESAPERTPLVLDEQTLSRMDADRAELARAMREQIQQRYAVEGSDPAFAIVERIRGLLASQVWGSVDELYGEVSAVLDTLVAERLAMVGDATPKLTDDDAIPALGRLAVLAEHLLLNHEDGRLTLAVSEQQGWTAGLEFGHEAEGSDMVGGAAYGTGDTAADALRQALHDAGENV